MTAGPKRIGAGAPLQSSPPVALTIAGSDSSAGAGIQADLKTFSALGVYGVTAVTCVVAETPGKVSRIEPLGAEIVREQIEVLLANFPIAAIKTGLLSSADIVSVVAQSIAAARQAGRVLPLVVDPVMIATSGDRLLPAEAVEAYEKQLFPLATLITPNLDEAGTLLGRKVPDLESMNTAVRALSKKYGVSVLLKGGHLDGAVAVDLLFHAEEITEFTAPFTRGVATHGTGCTYSAAITAGLASQLSLTDSIRQAKKFVSESIQNHFQWSNAAGNKIQALKHNPK
jgi:hydroxymethylpyrimidine/phosphomethylpyrimidine kinase